MAAVLRRIILAAALVSSVMAQATADKSRTIRVVMDRDLAPYSFKSEEGKLQGILVDQWGVWERSTGIKVEIHAMDWGEALQRTRAGEFDAIDSIFETPERRAYLDFTPAYTSVDASIFFRKDISGIANVESMQGFQVGVKAGDQLIERLAEKGVTSVVPFPNYDQVVEAARQHKINVFVVDVPSAMYLLNKKGIAGEFRYSAPIFQDGLRRAVRKGDANLLRAVTEGFAAIDPAVLRQIDHKWFGYPIDGYRQYLPHAAYIAAAVVLLVAALMASNRVLRRAILRRTVALSESEERFRQFAENIREVCWMTTPGLDCMLYVSPRYATLWGRSTESLREHPRSFLESIHPEDRERAIGIIEGRRDQAFELEYRIVRPDGSVRWIRDRGFPVKDASGRTYRVVGIAEDITERKRAEDRGRLVIDAIPTMAWSLRSDGAVDFVNRRWLEYTGLSVEAALEDPNRIVHPADRKPAEDQWRVDMSSGEPREYELRLRRADGEYRWFLVRVVPLRDEQGNVIKWYGAGTDIEDRKRAEYALRDTGAQLQALSRRLVELQESERKALARELHDRVGQSLTALKINIDMLQPVLAAHGDNDGAARLADSAALVAAMMDTIENVMSELHPTMLDDHGLAAALDWHARNFARRTGIAVTLRAGEPVVRPPPEVEIALFRIAQEALNNVAKHASARHAGITLGCDGRMCVMSVQDDGIGLNAGWAPPNALHPRLGIVTMRERSQAVGGRFEVHALPDGGTRLTVQVPCS